MIVARQTTLNCLWMMPRDPDTDMCPGTETVLVSMEECMAHQSCVPSAGHDGGRSALASPSAKSLVIPTVSLAVQSAAQGEHPVIGIVPAHRIGEAKDACEAALVQALAAPRHPPKA